MQITIRVAMLAVCCFWATTVVNAQGTDSVPSDLIQSDTIAIASIDLTAIDVDAATKFVMEDEESPQQAMAVMSAKGLLMTFRDAGATRIYFTIPAEGIISGAVCAIIPCDDAQSVSVFLDGLVKTINGRVKFVVVKQDKRIVVCPESMAGRFDGSSKNAERPTIAAGLESLAMYPHRLVVAPPQDIREAVAATWPDRLPGGMGLKFSPKAFASDVEGLAFGWALPPQPEFELRLFGVDGESAKRARDQIQNVLALAGDLARNAMPSIEEEDQVVLKMDAESLLSVMTEVLRPMREAAKRSQGSNNLKQLALAMHNYADAYKKFPAKAIYDKDGKPLLSWRVALLPFLDAAPLYNQFRLDEAWDSPHNKALIAQMPMVFRDPNLDGPGDGKTRYRVPVMAGTVWEGTMPLWFRDITDGTSNTIWFAEAPVDQAIEWTRPDDWNLSEASLIEDFFGNAEMTLVSFIDGSVSTLVRIIDPETLKHLLQMADGNPVQRP